MEHVAKRGVKRKREAPEKAGDIHSKLRAKLHHAVKKVKKASKKAKAFEAQRIVKKLRDARKGGDECVTKNLESQLGYIKHINLEDIAVTVLRSKIKKDAILSKNADCQGAVSSELPFSTTTSKPANDPHERTAVESRLMSSKILSAEVAEAIRSVRLVLDVGGQEMQVVTRRSNSKGLDEGEEGATQSTTWPSDQIARSRETANEAEEGGEEKSGDENIDGVVWTGFNGETIDELEQDDEGGGWESGSICSQDQAAHSFASDDSQSASSRQASSKKKVHPSAALPEARRGKAGESTFLPSLAVGFISGNSDSEWSDAESNIADMPVKKNRRGQRARKAIWEKKYGKNANHLRKQRENDVSAAVRSAYGQRGGRGRGGGASRRGVVRGRGRPITEETHASPPNAKTHLPGQWRGRDDLRQRHGDRTAGGDSKGKSTSNVRPRAQSHGDDSKPLHPSWEAKRRMKEKQSPAIVPSMGTRIKFA